MKNFIIIHGLILDLVFNLSAQKTDSTLQVMATRHVPEKIYIHYDKEYYVAGETIWFKAYLYCDGKPSGISSNLYLQFTDNKGQVTFNKQYPVSGAVANGNIDLPDSLLQGNYYIRAFTAGMLNEDEAFIYKKNVFVLNPADKTVINNAGPEPSLLSIQFFPESGNLVDGILSVVGFKATDQWGTPVDVKGVIKTEDDMTISSFKSYHDGIGKFQFKPQAGKKYIANVVIPAVNGTDKESSYPLPPVLTSGINLKIQDEKGGKKFQLSRSEIDKSQFEDLTLVAEINNHIVYENEIFFDGHPSVIGHLITGSLPSGILHFTVFNKAGIPLAERLSFEDNGEYRGVAAVTQIKTSFEKKAENIFEINYPDSIQRSCSVAVIDMEEADIPDHDNIWSRFLLTSDLKGTIYNPAWYFVSKNFPGDNQNDSVKQALDNLMLTHGWSRFNWSKILSNEFPRKKYKDSYLLNISGMVYTEKDNKPVESGLLNVMLSTEDSSLLTYDIPVKENGGFLIDSLAIFGRTKLYFTYKDRKGNEKPVTVKTNDNFLPGSFTEISSGTAPKNQAGQIRDSKKPDWARRIEFINKGKPEAKLLENVLVTGKPKRPMDLMNEKFTSQIFRSGGKIVADNINDPPADKSMNGFDFVKNRIVTVDTQRGTFINKKNFSLENHKDRMGDKDIALRYWEVGLFINEVPADLIQLKILRADKIAMVKFFEAGFLGAGQSYPGGAIAVYLNDENEIKNQVKPSKYIEYDGYSISKEFYSPDYSVPGTNKNKEDNRTTLYWNPEIVTEKKSGTAQLKFFNNDFSKKLKIVVEGFDANGRLIHIEKITGE